MPAVQKNLQLKLLACQEATRAAGKTKNLSKIASHIKQEMDFHFGPMFHCIVGTDFGTSISNLDSQTAAFCVKVEDRNLLVIVWKTKEYETAKRVRSNLLK